MAILVIFGACIYFDEFSDTLTGVAARAQLQAPITAAAVKILILLRLLIIQLSPNYTQVPRITSTPKMKDPAKNTFVGAGGVSARAGFLFALSLIPSIMLAIGIVNILQHYGALSAAQKLMTPLFKPLMDVPGLVGLTLITDLQSTDAGAALTKELYDLGLVDKREETIIAAWQYSGAGMINNYFAIASALFGFMACPILIPLAIIFVMKFIGAIICRFALDTIYKGDFKHGK